MYSSIKELRRRRMVCEAASVVFGVVTFVCVCLAIGYSESGNTVGAYLSMAGMAVGMLVACESDSDGREYERAEEEQRRYGNVG